MRGRLERANDSWVAGIASMLSGLEVSAGEADTGADRSRPAGRTRPADHTLPVADTRLAAHSRRAAAPTASAARKVGAGTAAEAAGSTRRRRPAHCRPAGVDRPR